MELDWLRFWLGDEMATEPQPPGPGIPADVTTNRGSAYNVGTVGLPPLRYNLPASPGGGHVKVVQRPSSMEATLGVWWAVIPLARCRPPSQHVPW